MNLKLSGYTEREVLEAVLAGLEAKRVEVVAAIEDIRSQLSGEATAPVARRGRPAAAVTKRPVVQAKPKRKLSADAIARIREGQRKRWAKAKKAAKAASKGVKPAPEPVEVEVAVAEVA